MGIISISGAYYTYYSYLVVTFNMQKNVYYDVEVTIDMVDGCFDT